MHVATLTAEPGQVSIPLPERDHPDQTVLLMAVWLEPTEAARLGAQAAALKKPLTRWVSIQVAHFLDAVVALPAAPLRTDPQAFPLLADPPAAPEPGADAPKDTP